MNKITFTNAKGFVVAVVYNEISDTKKAVDIAAMQLGKKYSKVSIEKV